MKRHNFISHVTVCVIAALTTSACSPILPIENPFTGPQASMGRTESPAGNPLRIEVLDVGQGDSTLVIGPTGKTMLIDAGRAGEGTVTVLPDLQALGIDHLSWIIATHYDADHIGGLSEVVKGPDQMLGTDDDLVPTSDWLDRGDFTDKSTRTYADYVAIAEPYRHEATPGMRFDLGDGVTAEVVVVNGHYEDGRMIPLDADEENEACIGLLIRYGGFRYFTAGDLSGGGAPGGFETKDMETITGEIIGAIDVLHVGHHGSETSSNEVFLEETKPEVALISVGADNDYGHPAATTLERLDAAGALVYRTDRSGTIEVISDGIGYEIQTSSSGSNKIY
jgi:competence protein ComEC